MTKERLPNILPDELAIAGVVHDVNQMLAVVIGRAGLLLQTEKDPDLIRHARAMELAAGDAARMLRRLHQSPGLPVAAVEPICARDIVEQVHLLVWPTDSPKLVWQNKVPPGTGVGIPAPVLREVLCNLLLNALAGIPVTGEILVEVAPAQTDRVILKMVDNGPGLPAGDPEHIFIPGVTGSGDLRRGIGLAACRQLLEGVGGTLTAAKNDVGGATFILDLPVAVAVAAPEALSTDVPAPVAVMVVDDEAVVREMLDDVLDSWGCGVQTYRDAADVMQNYQSGSAKVALVDRNLPGTDGLELASLLRKNDPLLYIVLMSGWQRDPEQTEPAVADIDRQVAKPLPLSELAEILRSCRQEGNIDDRQERV